MAKPTDIQLPRKFIRNHREQHTNGTISVMRFTDNIKTMKKSLLNCGMYYTYPETKNENLRYYKWHNDGTFEMKKIYKKGKLHHDVEYHSNGQLAWFVNDNNTKEHTLYVRWDEDGEVDEKEVYHKGKIVSYYVNK
jgi:antitoxin component YwqK of YwqJK toxin-antitoxin module